MEDFACSDLAAECDCKREQSGVGVSESEVGACRILRVQIKTAEAAARMGKPMGHYVTVECGMIHRLGEREESDVCRTLGVELRSMAERLCGKRVTGELSVLVAGLGNRDSTVDAVGPETLRYLSVTRQLSRVEGARFSTVGACRLSAIEPGVPALTGLESAETVKGIVQVTRPDLVIAVDALTARSAWRLGSTVQLSDGGLRPASGVGRGHCALDRESLGVPVLALGVPTAVRSERLLRGVLDTGEGTKPFPAERLQGGSHLITLGEIDLLVRRTGALLARSIERAFSTS